MSLLFNRICSGNNSRKETARSLPLEHQTFEIVSIIQRLCDYLGGELCKVRWAIERHHQTSQAILRVLLDSLSNESRQYFEQGVRCYDTSEYEMAKERFNKALESDLTEYFAYQYLGFIGVADGKPDDAIRNFDLARKFANNNYHLALALSHLAKCYQVKDLNKAVELSNEAAKTHPDTAKSWYECAAYSARLRFSDVAISSLGKAISRDRTYWAIVTADTDFDLIRHDVVELQNTLREAARNGARRAIDDFRRTLDTSTNVGASQEVADFAGKLDGIELSYRRNNFFVFLDLISSVQDMREEIFKLSESKLKSLLKDKRQYIVNNAAEKRRKIKEVEDPIIELKAEKGSLSAWMFQHDCWLICTAAPNIARTGARAANFISTSQHLATVMPAFKRLFEVATQLLTLTQETQGNNSIATAPPVTTSTVSS